jgi:argininosuccinate lyase
MVLRKEILETEEKTLELVKTMLKLMDKNMDTLMPAYTHLQVAQPTTFAHWLASHAFAILRDTARLERAYDAACSCPMGSCAVAGTSFPIDRLRVAHMLGFKRLEDNTMDAVGSRDFVLEAMAALAIASTNISRLAMELIIWSSAEFGMISLPDEFSSTSSIMPQKKNPVVAEIARARCGKIVGNLAGALAITKALPQSYTLDLQDMTQLLWSSLDGLKETAAVMAKMLEKMEINKEVMAQRAGAGFSTATELADFLVKKEYIPFRDAHAVVGKLIATAIEEGKSIKDIGVADLTKVSEEVLGREIILTEEELKTALDPRECVKTRALPGGPAPKAVQGQLNEIRAQIKSCDKLLRMRRQVLQKAEMKLFKEAKGRAK